MTHKTIKIMGLMMLMVGLVGCPAARKLTNGQYTSLKGAPSPAQFYWNKDEGVAWMKVYDPADHTRLVIHEEFHFSLDDLKVSLDGKTVEARLQSANQK